jgi:hypothetical protein
MTQTLYCVMSCYRFADMTANGWEVTTGPDGPTHFLPVFESRAKALAWGGEGCHISEIRHVGTADVPGEES